jgi:hypothetical protein
MSCLESFCDARFEVLMAVAVVVTIFWDVTTCSLVDRYQHFGGTYYFHLQGRRVNFYSSVLKMQMSGSSETLAVIYLTANHHTPEDEDHLIMASAAVMEDCKAIHSPP